MKFAFIVILLFSSFPSLAEEKKILAYVRDMTCPMCAAAVEAEVKKVKGFKKVNINISKGVVAVTGIDLSKESVSLAINRTKFKVIKIEIEKNEK